MENPNLALSEVVAKGPRRPGPLSLSEQPAKKAKAPIRAPAALGGGVVCSAMSVFISKMAVSALVSQNSNPGCTFHRLQRAGA